MNIAKARGDLDKILLLYDEFVGDMKTIIEIGLEKFQEIKNNEKYSALYKVKIIVDELYKFNCHKMINVSGRYLVKYSEFLLAEDENFLNIDFKKDITPNNPRREIVLLLLENIKTSFDLLNSEHSKKIRKLIKSLLKKYLKINKIVADYSDEFWKL